MIIVQVNTDNFLKFTWFFYYFFFTLIAFNLLYFQEMSSSKTVDKLSELTSSTPRPSSATPRSNSVLTSSLQSSRGHTSSHAVLSHCSKLINILQGRSSWILIWQHLLPVYLKQIDISLVPLKGVYTWKKKHTIIKQEEIKTSGKSHYPLLGKALPYLLGIKTCIFLQMRDFFFSHVN